MARRSAQAVPGIDSRRLRGQAARGEDAARCAASHPALLSVCRPRDQPRRSRAGPDEMVKPRFFIDEPFNISHAPSLAAWDLLREKGSEPIRQVTAAGVARFQQRATARRREGLGKPANRFWRRGHAGRSRPARQRKPTPRHCSPAAGFCFWPPTARISPTSRFRAICCSTRMERTTAF